VKIDYKSAGLLCGFLLVLFGAMPLNGYVGFLISPSQFHQDAFIGSFAHLLIGLIPLLSGVVLIVLGCDRPLQILLISIVGLVLGLVLGEVLSVLGEVLSMPGNIRAKDRVGCLGWLTISALSLLLAVAARAMLNAYVKWRGQRGTED
jgi:hypothetical protein